ncbi:MAG: enoyl-CoA hydratase [Alphaproteobacteria bacterium]|nr:enoyl-CoA hydratase [Alphaproteobacteria bacterium]MCB9931067.1 enoyl-CoA hydratase [Alphaproteobacteria bacterium]
MNHVASPLVTRTDVGPVSHVTLNRPQQGNSLSEATIDALHATLCDLREARDIAVIVLSGTGKRIFCAGHDLKEFMEDGGTAEFSKAIAEKCSAMMLAIREQPQIVIAKVEGVASAAGCQLVAAADLAIAESGARFATPGVNIGLWCLTPMVPLSRAVHPKHAMMMLATGRLFDTGFALDIGLINEAVAPEDLDATVERLAGDIAAKSTYTLAVGKAAFYRQLQMSIDDAYEYAGNVTVRNMAHHDAREGIRAFVEKRPPVWKGR